MSFLKLALPLLLITNSAFAANITVVYNSGNPTSVPTLNSTMLFILSALFVLIAFRIKKQNNSGTAMIVSVLTVAALVSSAGGIKLISNATAGAGPGGITPFITDGSGTISVNPPDADNEYITTDWVPAIPLDIYGTFFSNNTNGAVTIGSIISADNSCAIISTDYGVQLGSPHCSVGDILAIGDTCYVACSSEELVASDIRLKHNIEYLTELNNGLKLYSFKYIERHTLDQTEYVGVMAQDLLKDARYKDAVVMMSNGFYAVNYRDLGLKMISLKEWNASQQNILIDNNQITHHSAFLKSTPTLWKPFHSK